MNRENRSQKEVVVSYATTSSFFKCSWLCVCVRACQRERVHVNETVIFDCVSCCCCCWVDGWKKKGLEVEGKSIDKKLLMPWCCKLSLILREWIMKLESFFFLGLVDFVFYLWIKTFQSGISNIIRWKAVLTAWPHWLKC